VGLAPTTSADAPNLAYARNLSWHLNGAPELSAMESTIRSVLSDVHVMYPGVDGQQIEGFYPGPTYSYARLPGWTPFYLYIRDTATDLPMVRYYYGTPALRSSVEEFLREQYPDGSVSATIGPDFKVDKATVVSDEETSAIVDAVEAYDALPDPAWLNQPLRGQTLIERPNRAMGVVIGVSREPDITQTMIYLGREKGTNQRIMIGASERPAYKGKSRSGVNVFDFKVERAKPKATGEPGPVFVGYGRIPGLGGK